MTLRDYQLPAIAQIIRSRRGIVQAPAGSGKTIIGAAALDQWSGPRCRLSRRKMNVAWVANTLEQCTQAIKAMGMFPAIREHADVAVFCYQSGRSMDDFDLVILDECHHIAAPAFRLALAQNNGWRWGLSATPNRADELQTDVFELIGPIVHVVERDALVNAGQLAKAKVIIHSPNEPGELEQEITKLAMKEFETRCRRFRFNTSDQEQKNRCVWQFANEIGIATNQKRNDHIVELGIKHSDDSTLIIIGKIEHGDALCERIPNSLVVHSKLGAKRRREAIAAFGAGNLKCMIATSLADEGLDVPRANVLILAAAGRSAAKAEQRTGRVLRAFHDKTHGTIHDFNDQQHYFLKAQSKQRIRLYESLGYQVPQRTQHPIHWSPHRQQRRNSKRSR